MPAFLKNFRGLFAAVLILAGVLAMAAPAMAQIPGLGRAGSTETGRQAQLGESKLAAAIKAATESELVTGLKAAASSLLGLAAYYTALASGYVASWVFQGAAYAIEIGMALNASIIKSPSVKLGWTMTRNFANLGFVLAMIFIAYATMLRLQNYDIKKMLGRLVVIALLINFSLAISGVILDFSHKISNLFIDKIGVGPNAVANLAGAINVQRALDTRGPLQYTIQEIDSGIFEPGKNSLQALAGIVFATTFTVLTAITLGLISVMIFIRYLWIIGLLIVAPLAWLSFVFKPVERYFSMWWDKLIKWAMYLPILMFFLYLTVITMVNFKTDPASPAGIIQQTSSVGVFVETAVGTTFASYAQIAVALAFMVMGLYIGEKFSIMGAATAMAYVKRSRSWALERVKGGGRLLNPFAISVGGKTVGEKLAVGLTKIAPGRTFEGAINTIEGLVRANTARVETARKEFDAIKSEDRLLAIAGSRCLNDADSAAILETLTKRKLAKKVGHDRMMDLAKRAAPFGGTKIIEKIRPDLVSDTTKIEKIVRGMKPKELFETIDPEALENPMVVATLTDEQRKYLAKGEEITYGAITSYLKGLEAAIVEGIAANKKEGKAENEGLLKIPAVAAALRNTLLLERIREIKWQKEDDVPKNLWNIISFRPPINPESAPGEPEMTQEEKEKKVAELETLALAKHEEVNTLETAGDKNGAEKAAKEQGEIEKQIEEIKKTYAV